MEKITTTTMKMTTRTRDIENNSTTAYKKPVRTKLPGETKIKIRLHNKKPGTRRKQKTTWG
jgi:hypothetical protein